VTVTPGLFEISRRRALSGIDFPDVRDDGGDTTFHSTEERPMSVDAMQSSDPIVSSDVPRSRAPDVVRGQDESVEPCRAEHPTIEGTFCYQPADKFHPDHLGYPPDASMPRQWWVNEPHEAIREEFRRRKERLGRKCESWWSYWAKVQECGAEPVAITQTSSASPLELGKDPRPPWKDHAREVLRQVCLERAQFSELNIWPLVAFPKGFGGAGLMRQVFNEAEEDGLCMLARNADGSPKSLDPSRIPPVVALDGTPVKFRRLVPVFRSTKALRGSS
jgi:hypothetical protein